MASKLMARKRPRLIPVFDSIINAYVLGGTGVLWQPLHAALRRDECALQNRLVNIREGAKLPDYVSALRIFDVLCWMEGSGHA